MLTGIALVPVTVVAGHLRHHHLRISALHVSEELGRGGAAELRSHDSVMPNRHVAVLIGDELESLGG